MFCKMLFLTIFVVIGSISIHASQTEISNSIRRLDETSTLVPTEMVHLFLGRKAAIFIFPMMDSLSGVVVNFLESNQGFLAVILAMPMLSLTELSIALLATGLGGLGALAGYGVDKVFIDQNAEFETSFSASLGAVAVLTVILVSVFVRMINQQRLDQN